MSESYEVIRFQQDDLLLEAEHKNDEVTVELLPNEDEDYTNREEYEPKDSIKIRSDSFTADYIIETLGETLDESQEGPEHDKFYALLEEDGRSEHLEGYIDIHQELPFEYHIHLNEARGRLNREKAKAD